MDEAFRQEYQDKIRRLVVNSKTEIVALTILADKFKDTAALTVVELVLSRILQVTETEPQACLPALYLMDSIVKNVRNSGYAKLFGEKLVKVFTHVFDRVPMLRPNLEKLLRLWEEQQVWSYADLLPLKLYLLSPVLVQVISQHQQQQTTPPPPPPALPQRDNAATPQRDKVENSKQDLYNKKDSFPRDRCARRMHPRLARRRSPHEPSARRYLVKPHRSASEDHRHHKQFNYPPPPPPPQLFPEAVCLPLPDFRVNDSLRVKNCLVIAALYESLPLRCQSCGLRFLDKSKLQSHLDWHFAKYRAVPQDFRGWLEDCSLKKEEDQELEQKKDLEKITSKKQNAEAVPSIPAHETQKTCPVCTDPFTQVWDDEQDSWMFLSAVLVSGPQASDDTNMSIQERRLRQTYNGVILHDHCFIDQLTSMRS
jgi:hypothetical protein